MSGLDVLRAIRTRVPVTVPVLFLTARDTEQDVIEALEAGADDFVVKPVRNGELQARPRALWRRNSRFPDTPDTYGYDRFRFELKLSRAWVDGEIPSRTIDTHVPRVRSELGLRPERHYLLAPVYSYGYRLEHLLTSTAAAGSASCGEPG